MAVSGLRVNSFQFEHFFMNCSTNVPCGFWVFIFLNGVFYQHNQEHKDSKLDIQVP